MNVKTISRAQSAAAGVNDLIEQSGLAAVLLACAMWAETRADEAPPDVSNDLWLAVEALENAVEAAERT